LYSKDSIDGILVHGLRIAVKKNWASAPYKSA
jgi:hypothetical protein